MHPEWTPHSPRFLLTLPLCMLQIGQQQGRVYRKASSWYPSFISRASRLWGIDQRAHQQQSAGRAAVTEATINEFKAETVIHWLLSR